MGLANCIECGKVFVKQLDNICPACVKVRENEIDIIREWITKKEFPKLQNIEAETGISESNFRKNLLEGRIKAFKKVIANCEVCGKETNLETKNIICKDCRGSLKKAQGIDQKKKELQDSKLYSKTDLINQMKKRF